MRLRNALYVGLLLGLSVALSACATGSRPGGAQIHDDEMLPGRQVRLAPDHVVEYRVMFFVNRRDESERELYDEDARDPKIEETHSIYLPFLEIVQYDPAIASPQAERAIEDGMNPLARVFPLDQPLLEVWSRKRVAITQLAEGGEVTREAGRRIRVLDTLPVGLFQHDRWLGGQSHMGLVNLPLCGLALYEETAAERAFTMVGTAGYDTWLPDWTGEPLIALWHQTQSQRHVSRQALRLPLLGPVWAWWKEPVEDEGADWETHWSIFPRITHWKSFDH